MAQDHSQYLAINVLNELQMVSYRTLSRALKVHSNLAKQMLYDFHRKQNAKKAGSVHATYLITGTRKPQPAPQSNGAHSADGGDTVMLGSPPLPSSSAPERQEDEEEKEQITVRLMVLVKEEDLGTAKAQFESITGIHIYSLEHGTLDDLHVLTECNRKIAASYASEDPLEAWKQYGTIQNLTVKRRVRRTAVLPAAPTPTTAAAKPKPLPSTRKPIELEKQAPESEGDTSAKPTPEPEKLAKSVRRTASGKPVPVKRQDSNIFKSFAKGKTKAKKEDTESSAGASPAAEPDDVQMQGMSEDEGDDSGLQVDGDEVKAPSGKSKQEREAEIKAMMDQEDEPMDDAPIAEPETEESEEPAAPIDVDNEDSQHSNEPAETIVVTNGRRRGRRRIMKTKTFEEDGYIVTKEEAAWESFSEDEPAPKNVKVPPAASTLAPKGKKGAKQGQGDIMSFFSKR